MLAASALSFARNLATPRATGLVMYADEGLGAATSLTSYVQELETNAVEATASLSNLQRASSEPLHESKLLLAALHRMHAQALLRCGEPKKAVSVAHAARWWGGHTTLLLPLCASLCELV